MDANKAEYIEKLKKELDMVEERYKQIIAENTMITEDYRSRAHHNYLIIRNLEAEIIRHNTNIVRLEGIVKDRDDEITKRITEKENLIMGQEDTRGRYFLLLDKKNDWERLTHVARDENKDLMKRLNTVIAEKQAI